MATIKEDIFDRLQSLIEEGGRLESSFQKRGGTTYRSNIDEEEHRRFFTTALHAIERIAGRDSRFFQDAPKPNPGESLSFSRTSYRPVVKLKGVLVALRDAVNHGLLTSIESELRASIHDNILEQASDLLNQGYHVAAMVQIGGILENHLGELCENRDLDWNGKGSIGAYNDALKDEEYNQMTWRRIQAIADARNDAAHGNFKEVEAADVEDHLDYVRRVITNHPE